MVIFFVGTGGATIVTGLTDGPVALALGLAAIGLFGSIYHPVGTAWLVRNAVNRGRALGWNGISGGIGLAAAPFVAGKRTTLRTMATSVFMVTVDTLPELADHHERDRKAGLYR